MVSRKKSAGLSCSSHVNPEGYNRPSDLHKLLSFTYIKDHLHIYTVSLEVIQGQLWGPMVDHISEGEQSEGVKQLEDGIAWLVDGHDNDAVLHSTQPATRSIIMFAD